MPKSDMFTNQAVLNDALKMTKWKSDLALQIFTKYPKNPNATFDARNLTPLAAMIIDAYDFPENEREARFTEEVEKMAKAFHTLDPDTMSPYPDVIKPYIKKIYGNLLTDLNEIDWNNEKDVERALCTLPFDQGASTVLLDFKKESLEVFETADELFKIDSALMKMHFNFLELDRELRKKVPNLNEHLNVASSDISRIETQINVVIGNCVAEGSTNGTDVINVDATENQYLRDSFLKKPFSVEEVFDSRMTDLNNVAYTDAECRKAFLYELLNAHSRAPFELMVMKETLNNADDFSKESMLLINGKTIEDIAKDFKDKGHDSFEANNMAATYLRDALTDGKSVVTLMRVGFDKDGNTKFRHQEVKLDLDKLNKSDFEERYKKANFFRKLLHDYGIWKISNKYASNEARDKAQEKIKDTTEYKNSLRAAEKFVVKSYNSIKPMKDAIREKRRAKTNEKDGRQEANDIVNVLPSLSLPNDQNVHREKLPPITELSESKNTVKPEPKIDDIKLTKQENKVK